MDFHRVEGRQKGEEPNHRGHVAKSIATKQVKDGGDIITEHRIREGGLNHVSSSGSSLLILRLIHEVGIGVRLF